MATKATDAHATKKAIRREEKLMTELCLRHLYMFMDSLPERDRSTMIYVRSRKKGGGHDLIHAVVIKLAVPADGSLGSRIMELRKKKRGDAAARKRRPKMRPLSKIGPGPS